MAFVERYVSPASSGGDGTEGNPWDFATAVTGAVAGDRVNISGGTYSEGALTFPAGTLHDQIVWRGFNSDIGDLDEVGRDRAGPLIVNDFPSIALSGTWVPGTYSTFQNLNVTGTLSAPLIGDSSVDHWGVLNCKVVNNENHALAGCLLGDNYLRVENSDLECTGSTHDDVIDCDSFGFIRGSRIKGVETNKPCVKLNNGPVLDNVFIGGSGTVGAHYNAGTVGISVVSHNTFHGIGTCIKLHTSGHAGTLVISHNHATECDIWINNQDSGTGDIYAIESYNRLRDITTERIGVEPTIVNEISTSGNDDYVYQDGEYFTLLPDADGSYAGQNFGDIGAYQHTSRVLDATTLRDGLESHVAFQGLSTGFPNDYTNDSVGYSPWQTPSAAGVVAGRIGNALDCDAIGYAIAEDATVYGDFGDEDCFGSVWVKADDNTAVVKYFWSKYNTSSQRSWMLAINATHEFQLFTSSDGLSFTTTTATDHGAITPGDGQWHYVEWWHDSVNDEVGISVNGIDTTQAFSGGLHNSTDKVNIGRGSTHVFEGALDSLSLWRRLLNVNERQILQDGLAYEDWPTYGLAYDPGTEIPSVVDVTGSVEEGLSWVCEMPTGVAAGDLLMLIATSDRPSVTMTVTPDTWTQYRLDDYGEHLEIWIREATGTEGDQTITLSDYESGHWAMYCIRNAGEILEVWRAQNDVNAPGAKMYSGPIRRQQPGDMLILAICASRGTDDLSIDDVPTGYIEDYIGQSSGYSRPALACSHRIVLQVLTEETDGYATSGIDGPTWGGYMFGIMPLAPESGGGGGGTARGLVMRTTNGGMV